MGLKRLLEKTRKGAFTSIDFTRMAEAVKENKEQSNENWGAGVRSTMTDTNGHCLSGGSEDMNNCAAAYIHDQDVTSHDTYGVTCQQLN